MDETHQHVVTPTQLRNGEYHTLEDALNKLS